MQKYYDEIYAFIQEVPVFDTHEHFCFPDVIKNTKRDILSMIQNMYLTDDLRSCGFGKPQWQISEKPEEKWQRLKPFLHNTSNTTYFKVLQVIFRDLYGVNKDFLSMDYATLSQYTQESAAGGADWYREVLQKRANIAVSFLDKGQTTDFEMALLMRGKGEKFEGGIPTFAPENANYPYFRPILRTDLLSYGCIPEAQEAIAKKFGLQISSFEEYEDFLAHLIGSLKERGFYGIKSTLGYYRDLHFLPVDRETAANAWTAGKKITPQELRAFQDYVVYRLAHHAGQHNIVFEIHTGMRCFGSAYTTGNGPHELTELITANSNTKFDLFHAGYPWVQQAAAMAKSIPSAYLSLNWFTVISENMAKRYFSEVLDTVPFSKITWGGDCFYAEEAYAHCSMTRILLAEVLAEKAASGRYSLAFCQEIAAAILRNNAIALYDMADEFEYYVPSIKKSGELGL